MGRGQGKQQRQSARTLLFGPRRSSSLNADDKMGRASRSRRLQLTVAARENPFVIIDALDKDYSEIILLEAGPVKQTVTEKSWFLTPKIIGDKTGFEVRTRFERRHGDTTFGSAGVCWTLQEAVKDMRKDCELTKKIAFEKDAESDKINFDNAIDALVEMALANEIKNHHSS